MEPHFQTTRRMRLFIHFTYKIQFNVIDYIKKIEMRSILNVENF